MKLLHTSDWHIGHTLHDTSREEEHKCFLQWLVEVIERQEINALIVAGDIFDTSNPSALAQQIYYDFLIQCRSKFPPLDIVVIGGNHDSGARLDAPSSILKSLKIHVVGSFNPDSNKSIIPLYGDKNEPWAYVAGVPFLRDFDLTTLINNLDESEKHEKNAQKIYRDLFAEIRKRKEPHQAIIATGHCYLAHTDLSEQSERKIRGNLDAWNVSIFPDWISYVALGHLHKKQVVGSRQEVRYSGSPLPLSFSEINYHHSVCVVEFTNEKVTRIEELLVPRSRDLLRIPANKNNCNFEEFKVELAKLKETLNEKMIDDNMKPLLQVSLYINKYEPDLRYKIENEVFGLPLKLVDILIENKAEKNQTLLCEYQVDSLKEIDPMDIFTKRCLKELNEEPEKELAYEFRKLIDHYTQRT